MRIGQHIGSRIGQTQCVLELAVSEQSGIGDNDRPSKLEQQMTVENEAQSASIHFTRRVRRCCPGWLLVRYRTFAENHLQSA